MAETPTRRHFVRTGALAAGTVWAAPTIQSVRVLQTPGSPPPSSTSTTTTPSRTIAFDNTQFVTVVPTEDHPRCSDAFKVAFSMPFSELGEGNVTILACIVNFFPPEPSDLDDGLVTIVFGNGVLSGTGIGSVIFERIIVPFPVFRTTTHLDIEFTEGTGALAGATGIATYDRVEARFPPVGQTTNRFAGSITVPGA
jgi:hypothetical protein